MIGISATNNVLSVLADGRVTNLTAITVDPSNTLNLAGGVIVSGATNISGSGSITGGGVIQGWGTARAVDVDCSCSNGGLLALSNSVAPLVVANAKLHLVGGSTLQLGLGTNMFPMSCSNATLGASTLNLTDSGGAGLSNSYTLFTYGGTLTVFGGALTVGQELPGQRVCRGRQNQPYGVVHKTR